MILDLNWFKDKKVLVTGHTGFKGSWLCKILIDAGAARNRTTSGCPAYRP